MSPGIMTSPKGGKKKTYSKNGCRECKRRKIKCDESKPQCLQCSRLRKVCSYPSAGEKVLRVSKRYLMEHPEVSQDAGSALNLSGDGSSDYTPHNSSEDLMKSQYQRPTVLQYFGPDHHAHHHPHAMPLQQPLPPAIPYVPKAFDFQSVPHPQYEFPPTMPHMAPLVGTVPPPPPPAAKNPLKPPYSLTQSEQTPTPEIGSTRNTSPMSKYSNSPQLLTESNIGATDMLNYKSADPMENLFNREDLNLLASDLNNIVGSIMFESNFKRDDWDGTHSDVSNISNNSATFFPGDFRADDFPRNLPLDYISVDTQQKHLYLKEFYNGFANVILPFSPYDKVSRHTFNPARDIILYCASKEPFLLAAILAQGAKTAHQTTQSADDEEAYCRYLSKCLKLLGPALNESGSMKTEDLTSNIEAVLLTVLLLTSANASTTKQDWRPHLRGAKDLLIKYATNKPKFRRSKVLVWCKLWFVSFEILAGLSSKRGGTLKTDEELDLLICLDDPYEIEVLKELGLILDSGYNLLLGFHHDMIPTVRGLIKLLNRSRGKKHSVQQSDPLEYLRLLGELHKFNQVTFHSKQFVLTSKDFYKGVIPEGHLLEVQATSNNEKVVINWTDTTHRTYVMASAILILTKFLQVPTTNPTVQSFTYEILSSMSVLKVIKSPDLFSSRLLMMLWPILIAGMNSIDDSSKFIVKQYFKLSTCPNYKFFVNKLEKTWRNQKKGIASNYFDSDDETDTLTY